MDEIDELLGRLERWLGEHRPSYLAQLLPGLTNAEYRSFEEQLGVEMPEAFRALYRWRNGQAPGCFAGFQHNRQFACAQAILESKCVLDELQQSGEFDKANWWNGLWVPFLDNGGGDHLCVDLAGTFTGHSGQLLSFAHDWEYRAIKYPSIDAWLRTFVGSLERGLWEDVDGDLQPVNDEDWNAYYQELNAGYPLAQRAG